jgi:hypothetical protein
MKIILHERVRNNKARRYSTHNLILILIKRIRPTPSPKSTKRLRLASRSPFSTPVESPVDTMELRDLPTEKPMTRSLPSYNVPDPVPIDTPATSKTNCATLTRLARYNVNGLNQPTTHNLSTYLLVMVRRSGEISNRGRWR